jgi:hypothetical protein
MPSHSGQGAIERRGVKDPFLPPGPACPVFGKAGAPLGSPAAPPASASENALSPQPVTGDQPRGNAAAHIDRAAGAAKPAGAGSLVVVGTGVMAVNQVTAEGQRWIEHAGKVLYFGADPVTEHWLRKLNVNVESSDDWRAKNKSVAHTKDEIVAWTLECVGAGLSVCAVYDGAASVSGFSPHELMAVCRAAGHRAAMVPGISLADCLFADLGLDPLRAAYQIYDSIDFLVGQRRPDTGAGLILWRVGGRDAAPDRNDSRDRCHPALVAALTTAYRAEHHAILYEPALYAVCKPTIQRYGIGQLADARVTAMSSLYVPPKTVAAMDPDIPGRFGIVDPMRS